jgi:hypothetical protein
MKKHFPTRSNHRPSAPVATARILVEPLEDRIAPAGLVDIKYSGFTLGNPQLVEAGKGLALDDGSGAYLLAVEKGQAMVFTTDLNGNNAFDWNEITGIAAGDGLRMTLFADVNGDIVTNLQSNGFLSDSDLTAANGRDGLVLLNSRIDAITLRSVTEADFKAADKQGLSPTQIRDLVKSRLALSSYSVHGNVLAGTGIGISGLGFDGMPNGGIRIDTTGLALQVEQFDNLNQSGYQLNSILPEIGSLRTGTAAAPVGTAEAPNGQFFSFGYQATGSAAERGQVIGGYLLPFVPASGQSGGDILGFASGTRDPQTGNYVDLSPVRIDAIMTGDGGLGARGGNVENIVLFGDSGGLRILAGDGGDGRSGGAGGSILNLQDLGSTNSMVQIRTGDGGDGFLGQAGAAGQLSFGRFEMNGEIYVGLGSGGAGFTGSGAGTSLLSAELRPTDANGVATAVSVVTTYREIGDIGSSRLIDFNNDGFSDVVYLTHNPDQVIIKFGTELGIDDTTPTLYLASPSFSPLTGAGSPGRTAGLVVGDYNNDGWLDVVVAPSVGNSFGSIRVFLNPGNQFDTVTPGYNGWYEASLRTDGGNYIDSYISSPLPMLGPYAAGAQPSGMPIVNLASGDFTGDATLDLGVVPQAWRRGEIQENRPFSSLVMMTGMGDGRFFADFDYDRDRDTQRMIPVVNGLGAGSLGGRGGHYETELLATRGLAASPVEVLVAGTLKENNGGSRGIHALEFTPLLTDPRITILQPLPTWLFSFGAEPRYFSPIIVQGNITGWVPQTGTPSGFSITDFEGDGLFDIVVINQNNNLTVMTPLNGPAFNTGIVMTGEQGNRTIPGDPITYRLPLNMPQRNDVEFVDALAGNFGVYPPGTVNPLTGLPSPPTNFALYSLGTEPAPHAFYTFFFPGIRVDALGLPLGGGDAMANLTFVGAIGYAANDDALLNTDLIAWDKFATLTNSATYGVVSAGPSTASNGFRVFSGYNLPQMVDPVLGFNGDDAPPVFNGLNINAISLVAGNGGDSFFGSGGIGGSVGGGVLQAPVAAAALPSGAISVVFPFNRFIQPSLTLAAGSGGAGFVNGGAGGSISGVVISYAAGSPPPDSPFVDLRAGRGGDGLTGNGGAGGSLRELSILNRSTGIFLAGAGGLGQAGGAGGSVFGSGGRYGFDTENLAVIARGGTGGDGLRAGGAGGGVSNFLALYPTPDSISAPSYVLSYTAGRGGHAVAGVAGVGGSIRNSGPSAVGNNLGGPILLQAGEGGDGLQGGAGGSIVSFTNPSGSNIVSIVSAVAGDGGYGVTRTGGAGGSINGFNAGGRGIEALVDGEFNRLVAGDGGDSYGSVGGAGGSLVNVTSTSNNSAAVAAAGNGGAGLQRGGAGGDVRNATLDSTAPLLAAKVVVFAGHGGAAYAATATAPGLALPAPGNPSENPAILALRAFGSANGVGGNGGNITNFNQPTGVQTAVDLVAGNGGSLMNYGSILQNTSTKVGLGGSITGVSLRGEAGRVASDVAIRGYGADFVDRIVLNGWATLLNNEQGNVGVIAGEAGRVKDGVAGDGRDKAGSVSNFSATRIMSMVAGSVDRIASIKTISGVSSSEGVYGAYKTNPVPLLVPGTIPHSEDNPLYFDRAGLQKPSPVIGGRLMDGAVVAQTNNSVAAGDRVFRL